MIEMIVFPLIVVGLWLWAGEIPQEPLDWIAMTLFFGMTIALAIGAGAGVAAFLGEMLPTSMDATPSHTAPLVALRSADGISGSYHGGFFLGYGAIGSQAYYFYYESAGPNISTPRQLKAGQGVYVYEGDGEKPRVEVFDWHFTQPWWRRLAFGTGGQTFRFYVPLNSIQRGYSLQ